MAIVVVELSPLYQANCLSGHGLIGRNHHERTLFEREPFLRCWRVDVCDRSEKGSVVKRTFLDKRNIRGDVANCQDGASTIAAKMSLHFFTAPSGVQVDAKSLLARPTELGHIIGNQC